MGYWSCEGDNGIITRHMLISTLKNNQTFSSYFLCDVLDGPTVHIVTTLAVTHCSVLSKLKHLQLDIMALNSLTKNL